MTLLLHIRIVVVAYYIKLFRKEADRHNGILIREKVAQVLQRGAQQYLI